MSCHKGGRRKGPDITKRVDASFTGKTTSSVSPTLPGPSNNSEKSSGNETESTTHPEKTLETPRQKCPEYGTLSRKAGPGAGGSDQCLGNPRGPRVDKKG